MSEIRAIFLDNFNGVRDNINIVEPSDEILTAGYLQYLIKIYNEKSFKKYQIDTGLIKSAKKTWFVWGKNPLQTLEGAAKSSDSILDGFIQKTKAKDEKESLSNIIYILRAGAILSCDLELKKTCARLCKDYLDETGFKQSENVNSCKELIKNLIINNPKILNFIGTVDVQRDFTIENPHEFFQAILFDKLFKHFKPKNFLRYVGGLPNPEYKKEVVGAAKMQEFDFPAHDIILLLDKNDGKQIVINAELKFGKHRENRQLENQHLNLKKLFGDAIVKTILFAPFKEKEDSQLISTIPDTKQSSYFGTITIKPDDFIWCYSNINTIGYNLNPDALMDPNKLTMVIKDHINKLINEIENLLKL